MLNRDDLLDIIMERLLVQSAPMPMIPKALPEGNQGGGTSVPPTAAKRGGLSEEIRGRKFLSEYDIRKQLTVNSQELRINKDAIISPLAEDWLTLRRIKIIRE